MIKKILSSRQTYTIAAMFLIGGVEAVSGFIPGGLILYVQGALGMLAMYFRIDANVDFKK